MVHVVGGGHGRVNYRLVPRTAKTIAIGTKADMSFFLKSQYKLKKRCFFIIESKACTFFSLNKQTKHSSLLCILLQVFQWPSKGDVSPTAPDA